jgi:hypothetical protein
MIIPQVRSREQIQWGINEWFTLGEHSQVEQLLEDATNTAQLREARLAILLDEWNSPKGRDWYCWLTTQAAERLKVVLALYSTSPQLAHRSPPAWVHKASAYGKFFTEVNDKLGRQAEWLELADLLGTPAWPDASGTATLNRSVSSAGRQGPAKCSPRPLWPRPCD